MCNTVAKDSAFRTVLSGLGILSVVATASTVLSRGVYSFLRRRPCTFEALPTDLPGSPPDGAGKFGSPPNSVASESAYSLRRLHQTHLGLAVAEEEDGKGGAGDIRGGESRWRVTVQSHRIT